MNGKIYLADVSPKRRVQRDLQSPVKPSSSTICASCTLNPVSFLNEVSCLKCTIHSTKRARSFGGKFPMVV